MSAPTYDEIEQALSELQREAGVRTRVFPKWVQNGSMTEFESRERIARLRIAIRIVQKVLDLQDPPEESTGRQGRPGTGGEGVKDLPKVPAEQLPSGRDDVPF